MNILSKTPKVIIHVITNFTRLFIIDHRIFLEFEQKGKLIINELA